MIGRDVAFVGRWFRLVVGLYFSALALAAPLIEGLPSPAHGSAFLGEVGLYFVLILSAYVAVIYFLGPRILAHANPWISTLILLGPFGAITVLQIGPPAFLVAAGLYYSTSSVFNFAMSYGGCEVAAIPSLIFGRRYTIYCPYNAVDAVERAMLAETGSQKTMAVLSIVILVVVGGYFLLVEELGFVRTLGLRVDLPNQVALLLLIPLAYLSYNVRRQVKSGNAWWSDETRPGILGAATLLLLTVFFVTGVDALPIFGLVMLGAALVIAGRWALNRLTVTGEANTV